MGPACAVGAAIACPDRTVVNLQGDGGAMYTPQALWTQARESLHVVTLVCANRSYRILQLELARAGTTRPGPMSRSLVDLSRPRLDWTQLARGMGVEACSVDDVASLREALARALAEPGPQLVEMVMAEG
jgi:acetolactate synthase-1/2/3 large subunit